MPDARIPSLAPVGLDVVPGYTVLPNGQEDEAWRERHFRWQRETRDWRRMAQADALTNEAYRLSLDKLCVQDTPFFVTLWLEVEEPRAMPLPGVEQPRLNIHDLDLSSLGTVVTGGADDYQVIHPFIPFAYQVQAMQLFDLVTLVEPYRSQRLDVLWDKARGVGLTYAMLAAAYKNWLYRRIRGTILTEKWDKADKGKSFNTLFGKLDLFFNSTPDWIIPPGFKGRGEKGADRQRGALVNPKTGAQINTEPPTATATRSGREAYVMVDEGAFQEYLDEIVATAMGTTLHLFLWSTANWMMGMQWQNKVDEAKKDTSGTVKLIELEYYESPHQDKAWRVETEEAFAAKGLAEQFRVEYLREPASGGTLVYNEQVSRCPDTEEWWDPHRPLYVSCDPGIEDATAWVFWQTHVVDGKKRVRWLDSYEIAKMPVEFHAHLITGIEPRPPDEATGFEGDLAWPLWDAGHFGDEERYFMEWLIDVPPAMIEYYGDPAVLTKDFSHESFARRINDISEDIRAAAGKGEWGVFPMGASWKPIYKRNNFHERRLGMRKVLMYSEFSLTDGAQSFKQSLARTRFQEMTEKAVRAPGHIHDRYSHKVQAGEFGARWETLELTAEELKPARPEGIQTIRNRRTVLSPYQRQHKSLLGVA